MLSITRRIKQINLHSFFKYSAWYNCLHNTYRIRRKRLSIIKIQLESRINLVRIKHQQN